MNTERPHDIVSDIELRKLPEHRKSSYVEISHDEEEYLRDKNEEQRAEFLNLKFKQRLALILRNKPGG